MPGDDIVVVATHTAPGRAPPPGWSAWRAARTACERTRPSLGEPAIPFVLPWATTPLLLSLPLRDTADAVSWPPRGTPRRLHQLPSSGSVVASVGNGADTRVLFRPDDEPGRAAAARRRPGAGNADRGPPRCGARWQARRGAVRRPVARGRTAPRAHVFLGRRIDAPARREPAPACCGRRTARPGRHWGRHRPPCCRRPPAATPAILDSWRPGPGGTLRLVADRGAAAPGGECRCARDRPAWRGLRAPRRDYASCRAGSAVQRPGRRAARARMVLTSLAARSGAASSGVPGTAAGRDRSSLPNPRSDRARGDGGDTRRARRIAERGRWSSGPARRRSCWTSPILPLSGSVRIAGTTDPGSHRHRGRRAGRGGRQRGVRDRMWRALWRRPASRRGGRPGRQPPRRDAERGRVGRLPAAAVDSDRRPSP